MIVVDLGCGGTKRGDIGIDITPPPATQADIICNLGFEKIALDDNSVDEVVAHHFLEHIPDAVYVPRTVFHPKTLGGHVTGEYEMEESWHTHRPHIFLFNEVFRILKNRGIFYVQVPIVTLNGQQAFVQAFQDPQHVSYWTAERVRYFSGDYYGFHDVYEHTSRFQMTRIDIGCGHGWPWCMEFELIAIKDVPKNTPYQLDY